MKENNQSSDIQSKTSVSEQLKQEKKQEEKDITQVALKNLEQFKMDYGEEIQKPEIVLGANQDERYIPILTVGNFSVVTGKPKSKKSTLMCLFAAGYLRGTKGIYHLSSESNDGKILWIDTEQNTYHLSVSINNVFKMAPDSENRIDTYRFRNMDPSDRFANVKHLIDYYTKKGTKLIVLDGAADLLSVGYNDEQESIKISNYLLKATEENNCHIITVLHQNKANDHAKGHLGSYLNQKAETVLSVTKDSTNPEISSVSAQLTRNEDFKPFKLFYNGDVPTIDTKYVVRSEKGKIDFGSIAVADHKRFLTEFKSVTAEEWFLRKEIQTFMQASNVALIEGCSESMSKHWLEHLVVNKLLVQDKARQNSPYKINFQ